MPFMMFFSLSSSWSLWPSLYHFYLGYCWGQCLHCESMFLVVMFFFLFLLCYIGQREIERERETPSNLFHLLGSVPPAGGEPGCNWILQYSNGCAQPGVPLPGPIPSSLFPSPFSFPFCFSCIARSRTQRLFMQGIGIRLNCLPSPLNDIFFLIFDKTERN